MGKCRQHGHRGAGERHHPRAGLAVPRHLYEAVYCARGQAENLIKQHKVQLASDRTSCQSPLANQFRLVLHNAAYWLMLALRDAVPRRMPLAWSEFATLRQRLLPSSTGSMSYGTVSSLRRMTQRIASTGLRIHPGSVGRAVFLALAAASRAEGAWIWVWSTS